jgi:hypothetical protein
MTASATFRAPVTVPTLTLEQASVVENAAHRLSVSLSCAEGNAFPTGTFGDWDLFVDDNSRNPDFEVVEDDGSLHMNFGHFRLCCNLDQDSGRSEQRTVQERFASVGRRFFETHASQFEALLPA